jgi:hypothetical protein
MAQCDSAAAAIFGHSIDIDLCFVQLMQCLGEPLQKTETDLTFPGNRHLLS